MAKTSIENSYTPCILDAPSFSNSQANGQELLDAFYFLVATRPDIFDFDKKPKNSGKSMSNIHNNAFQGILENNSGAKSSSNIDKVSRIYEVEDEKLKGVEKLQELDLPRYRKLMLTLGDFLKDPAKYLAALDGPYFPSVTNPTTKGRVFKLGVLVTHIWHSECFLSVIVTNIDAVSLS